MVNVVNSVVDEGAPIQRKKQTTREEWLPILQTSLEKEGKKESICVAAEMDGHIVGWLAGQIIEGEDVPTASISTAVLAKKVRGFNFIALGINWLEKAKKEWGIKKIITETNKSNPALDVYKLMGFVEAGPSEKNEGYIKLEKNLE